jgi:hypothetical protein
MLEYNKINYFVVCSGLWANHLIPCLLKNGHEGTHT